MKELYFVTGNSYKFAFAQKALEQTSYTPVQISLETPEIQSANIEEIASYSAQWAAKELQKPVFVTDAGYDIKALHGFPGPFIKYINQYFTADDFIRLMGGKTDRRVIVHDCIAYCEPDQDPVLFQSSAPGTMATVPGAAGTTAINEVFIPDGYHTTESEIPTEELLAFWNKHLTHFAALAAYLEQR